MGQFNTNGGYFAPRDYFKVETGGSHDENPNGGVQIGMDTQGIPNMLEEGEPVYNDYVYSDNIEADADILRKHNLPVKFAGKLYSEIVDEYIDSSRPLDPISNNGMKAMLTRLADAQEEQKQIKEQQELEEELASLSPEEQEQLLAMLAQQEQAEAGAAEVPVDAQVAPEQIAPEAIAPEQIAAPQQMMAYGGTLLKEFGTGGPKKNGQLDEVAQAILDNEAAKSVGVDPTTGMRYEEPLKDIHPELDLALMYAQPGGFLSKLMAPSIARGTVEGLASGDGAQALIYGLVPETGQWVEISKRAAQMQEGNFNKYSHYKAVGKGERLPAKIASRKANLVEKGVTEQGEPYVIRRNTFANPDEKVWNDLYWRTEKNYNGPAEWANSGTGSIKVHGKSCGGTLLRRFDDGTPGQVVVVPPVYGDTSMLYGDPQRELVVPGPDMTRGGRARAAREAALAAGVNTGAAPSYVPDEVDQAIIDNSNARYASIGVDPATGMRTEAPLIDVHPELDVALAYAQPGTLLDKAFAPSMAKATVDAVSNGDMSQLAMGWLTSKIPGTNAYRANRALNGKGAAKTVEKMTSKGRKLTPDEKTRLEIAVDNAKYNFGNSETVLATADKDLRAAAKDFKSGKITKEAFDNAQAKYNEALEVHKANDAALKDANRNAKAKRINDDGTLIFRKNSGSNASNATPERTGGFPRWAKRTLMWGLPAGALGAGAVYGLADGWFEGGYRPAPEWQGFQDDTVGVATPDSTVVTTEQLAGPPTDSFLDSLMSAASQKYFGEENTMALGGKVHRYDGFGPDTSQMVRDAIAENQKPWWAGLNYQVTLPTSVPETTTLGPQVFDTLAFHGQQDPAPAESYVGMAPRTDTTTTHPSAQIYPTAGRYAKAVTSGLVGLYDAFTPADKYRFLPYNPQFVSAQMHLVDPRYRPQDWNSPLAGTLASSAGLARMIAASGNPASAPAALIGLDSSIGKNIGTVANTTWAANNQLYNNVLAARNRNASALGQFDFTKSRVNTGILNDKLKSDIQNDLLAQQLYFTGQGQKAAAIQNQIDVGADELVKDARQNFAFNQLNTNAYLDWLLAPNGAAAYYGSGKKTTKE